LPSPTFRSHGNRPAVLCAWISASGL
jgi:hypothetical protein